MANTKLRYRSHNFENDETYDFENYKYIMDIDNFEKKSGTQA